MNTEPQGSTDREKCNSGAKNGLAKRPPATARLKRRKGYQARTRNALYRLAAQYKRRHPHATAAEAWRHLVSVAATGAHDVIVAHDPAADRLAYRPDTGRFETREIGKRSFEQNYYRLSNISP